VRSGQPLAWVASPELGQAQSDARKSEQDYALAAKSFARVDELHTAGVAPLKDLQAAQADVARTAVERTRTLERLKLYGATSAGVDQRLALRSPVAGVVVERNLNPGQELRADQGDKALFVVSDPSRLWFTLDVPEADIRAVRPGASVQIGCAALGDERVAGKLVHIADGLDPQSRTVKVRGAINNAERKLKAEMFINAELALPSGDGLVVPAKAVYLRGEQHFVFVDAGGGKFVRRAVRLGPASQGQQVILEGVTGTDRVVIDGSLLLQQLLAAKE
jgi:cobalt-zinc-cadmium efflux system membrane fusion protein